MRRHRSRSRSQGEAGLPNRLMLIDGDGGRGQLAQLIAPAVYGTQVSRFLSSSRASAFSPVAPATQYPGTRHLDRAECLGSKCTIIM